MLRRLEQKQWVCWGGRSKKLREKKKIWSWSFLCLYFQLWQTRICEFAVKPVFAAFCLLGMWNSLSLYLFFFLNGLSFLLILQSLRFSLVFVISSVMFLSFISFGDHKLQLSSRGIIFVYAATAAVSTRERERLRELRKWWRFVEANNWVNIKTIQIHVSLILVAGERFDYRSPYISQFPHTSSFA